MDGTAKALREAGTWMCGPGTGSNVYPEFMFDDHTRSLSIRISAPAMCGRRWGAGAGSAAASPCLLT